LALQPMCIINDDDSLICSIKYFRSKDELTQLESNMLMFELMSYYKFVILIHLLCRMRPICSSWRQTKVFWQVTWCNLESVWRGMIAYSIHPLQNYHGSTYLYSHWQVDDGNSIYLASDYLLVSNQPNIAKVSEST